MAEGKWERFKNWFKNDGYLGIVGLLAFLIILIPYFGHFGGSFAEKQDVWGQFGDYVGGLMNPILSLFVLWTIIKTLSFTSRSLKLSNDTLEEMRRIANDEKKSQLDHLKLQNTFDLNLRFHSTEMLKTRTVANVKFKYAESKRMKFTIENLRKNLEEDFFHISNLMHFFEQVHLFRKGNLIDEKLARELFYRYFCYFNQFFKKIRESYTNKCEWHELLYALEEMEGWMLVETKEPEEHSN